MKPVLDRDRLSESVQQAIGQVSNFAYVFKETWSKLAKKEQKRGQSLSSNRLCGSDTMITSESAPSESLKKQLAEHAEMNHEVTEIAKNATQGLVSAE